MGKIEVVSASAGSGKTTRVARELRERIQSGRAQPENVLATTFTNKAAAELKERARTELIRAGLHEEAERLEGARIGTVNSVCGKLVADFAFELGHSPELRVIDEVQSAVALRRVISRVITDKEREQLSALAQRFEDLDWQKAVERLLDHARNNLLTEEDLIESGKRSIERLLLHLPPAVGDAEARDRELQKVIADAVAKLDPEDGTVGTGKARTTVLETLSALRAGPAPWKAWPKAKNVKPTKMSVETFEPIKACAAQVDTHPRLRSDLTNLIGLVFELTRRTLREWKAEKRELGVFDFIDQETLALQLLENPSFVDRIREQLDLVLVDEFQDTSPLQLKLFTILSAHSKNSLWVGDQKQAIFGFRGTDPALMDAALEAVLEGREPETLSKSYRSREPLVVVTSSLFSKAFASHGLPEARVRLEAANKDDQKLGPCIESWNLEGKNRAEYLAALADGIVQLLADESALIRSPADGRVRRPEAGDVAVLCRKNADCQALAAALAQRGLAATVQQAGLLATPEARAAFLGLRLFIDARDRLAAAELARLLLFPGDPNGWLDTALDKTQKVAFASAEFHKRLDCSREEFPAAGPLAALDAAIIGIGLREVLPRWGNSAGRHANLDALRARAVDYVARAEADGSAATPAGLVAYLEFIEEEGLDRQATLPGAGSVVISTWHGAKGLEWPITVLALVGRDPTLPRFGFSVRTTKEKFSLENPLEGRWVRYWPNPFSPSQTTELLTSLRQGAEAASEQDETDKQELRLLYVAWTRARDRLVLAKGDGGWMLKALGFSNLPNKTSTVEWGGSNVDILFRKCVGGDAASQPDVADDAPIITGPSPHEPEFVSPSTLEGAADKAEVTSLGQRMLVMGAADMNALGQAIHSFLACDRITLGLEDRIRLAKESLSAWDQTEALRPERMVEASDALFSWAQSLAPGATWHREMPIEHLLPSGSSLRGVADLVLESPTGFWIVDHKSFPGDLSQGAERAKTFAAQLAAYATACEAALGKPCHGKFIHLAVLSQVVRI